MTEICHDRAVRNCVAVTPGHPYDPDWPCLSESHCNEIQTQ
jgi:hypothetical protein